MNSNQIGDAIRAYRSDTCPACAAEKLIPADPFCLDCLERLPAGLLESVTDRETFLEAFGPAMAHLKNISPGPGRTAATPRSRTAPRR